VSLFHHVTRLLESNDYVRCLCIDFSKAFDIVDHAVAYLLRSLLHGLRLPEQIYMWILSFLSDRSQQVKWCDQLSTSRPINVGIIQGSGIGPMLYVILAADLKACSPENLILKYADDTNLLVPQCSDTSILDEFETIRNWTRLNKMQPNVKKTKELVFHRPNPRFSLPDPLPHIERVNGLKLLGVFLSANFKFDEHVNKMLCLCSQRIVPPQTA